MKLSFKTKVLLFFCPVIILISLTYTVAAIRIEQKLLKNEIIKRGEVLIAIAARSAELPLLSGNAELVKNAARSISEIKNVLFVTFYNPLFETILHEGLPATMVSPGKLSSATAFSVEEQTEYLEFYAPVFSIKAGGDIDMFEESSPDMLQKEHIGWVRVGLSKEVMHATERNMIRNGVLFSLLLVVIAVVLVTMLLNIMLRPLNTLFDAVKNLREGEYPQVPAIDQKDEIGQLSSEFNKMSFAIRDREEQLYYSQKE
jgi:methyl-accepting chemotaxis protein